MMAFVQAEGRKAPSTDQEAAAALRTMIAYRGAYKVEGEKWTTKVDGAWNPAWIGTDQIRSYRFNGDRLEVVTMWQPSVNMGGKVARGVLSWDRVK